MSTGQYYKCCGKSICQGCMHSFCKSGNYEKCPFCNSDSKGKADDEKVEELMKRVNVNDTSAMCNLANYYNNGQFFSAGSCKSKSNSETGRGTWFQSCALSIGS